MPIVPSQTAHDRLAVQVAANAEAVRLQAAQLLTLERAIEDLGTVTPPVDTPPSLAHTASWRIGGDDGWDYETRDSWDSIQLKSDHALLTSGGRQANSHYARIRRKLPEEDRYAATGPFWLAADIEIPADFHTRLESSMRLLSTDNYGTQGYGAADKNEWRFGFSVESDGTILISSEHQEPGGKLVLYRGSRLPTGHYQVDFDFVPSKTNEGSWELRINGGVVESQTGIQTVPWTVPDSEIAVTRIMAGIDGAWKQDTKSITVKVYRIDFEAA